MTHKDNLTHTEIEQCLLRANADVEAAEAHGQLCGMLCVARELDATLWIEHVLGDQDPGNILAAEARDLLQSLYETTRQQFADGNYEFEILLPDDELDLGDRIADLSSWCQGFLYGMSAAGVSNVENLPGEVGEVVQDFLEISRAGYDPDQDEEQNERAYSEVVEYLRVGSMLVYTEFNQAEPDEQPPTLH
ncbi:MAG: UPF0149 family protein [Gammaproteobacteria bacterium]|nr:UPF0149 family protein [Gammaproteobacteria bacterium]